MSRFDTYNRLAGEVTNNTKIGGDPQKAIAFAILALAEAILVTEDDGSREISGSVEISGEVTTVVG